MDPTTGYPFETSGLTRHVTRPGDIDSNNYVGLGDAITLSTFYGCPTAPVGFQDFSDINLDGEVGLKDAVLLAQHYGSSVP